MYNKFMNSKKPNRSKPAKSQNLFHKKSLSQDFLERILVPTDKKELFNCLTSCVAIEHTTPNVQDTYC